MVCQQFLFPLPGIYREHLMPVSEAACAENDTLHNMPCEVTPEIVYNALLAADAYGRAALEE